MKPFVLRYGLAAGVAILVLSSIHFVMLSDNLTPEKLSAEMAVGMLIGFATMFISMIPVLIGTRKYRNSIPVEHWSFLRMWGAGLAIAAIASIFYVISWEIWFTFTELHQFGNIYADAQIAGLSASGVSGAELESATKEIREFAVGYTDNRLYRIGLTFMEISPVAIIMSLLAGFFNRK